MSQEKSMNEQLAELCGMVPAEHGEFWANKDGRLLYEYHEWNPTTDLNQLRMCYEAGRQNGKPYPALYKYVFAVELEKLLQPIRGENYAPADSVTAWIEHPELVAQAILKAKGVS